MIVIINAHDGDVHNKLDAISAMDPSAASIDSITVDQMPVARGAAVPNLLSAGFEEIHKIEEGFCTHFMDGEVARHWRLTARSSQNCLRLRIPFLGQAHHDTSRARISDVKSRCTYIIQPAGASLTGVYREGEVYRFCTLNLSQFFLVDRLGLPMAELPRAILSGWTKQETVFGQIELNRVALATAGRFFNLGSRGAWRITEVKAIALDLLRQVFEAWADARTTSGTHLKLRPSEREQLQKLRSLADARAPLSVSMAEAVSLSGLNKNKVHIGFKRVFGMSLHDYCFDLRMQHARHLLTSTDMSVGRVAEAVGFSEPTNFTATFRKHFAILPSEVNRRPYASAS